MLDGGLTHGQARLLRGAWCLARRDEKELKSAFRKLAMKYHPDKTIPRRRAERKFKEINEAYELLKDPQKRAAYDRFGHAAFERAAWRRRRRPRRRPILASGFSDIFEDIFGEFMGGGRAPAELGWPRARSDLRYNMEITLEEAYTGKTAQIRVPTSITCEPARASGAKPGSPPLPDLRRHGQGARRAGFLHHRAHLPDLPGRGRPSPTPAPGLRRRRAA
jgi:molecular chaperone DnaJ